MVALCVQAIWMTRAHSISSRGLAPSMNAKLAFTAISQIRCSVAEPLQCDPVQLGLVVSLNRPGGNATGTTLLSRDLALKRLDLLHDLVPKATDVALLVNPTSPDADAQSRDLQMAASAVGMQVRVFRASNDSDIDTAFAAMLKGSAHALVVQADPFFTSRRDRLVTLANRHAIAAMYP